MRISDWSSDVCSSDLPVLPGFFYQGGDGRGHRRRRGYRRRQAFLHVDHQQRLARGGALDSAWRKPHLARWNVNHRNLRIAAAIRWPILLRTTVQEFRQSKDSYEDRKSVG